MSVYDFLDAFRVQYEGPLETGRTARRGLPGLVSCLVKVPSEVPMYQRLGLMLGKSRMDEALEISGGRVGRERDGNTVVVPDQSHQ